MKQLIILWSLFNLFNVNIPLPATSELYPPSSSLIRVCVCVCCSYQLSTDVKLVPFTFRCKIAFFSQQDSTGLSSPLPLSRISLWNNRRPIFRLFLETVKTRCTVQNERPWLFDLHEGWPTKITSKFAYLCKVRFLRI